MSIRRRSTHSLAVLLGGIMAVFASGCAGATSAPPAGPEPEDVVMIGYGAVDRDDVTGSTSSLTESDLENVYANRVGELLQGRVSGLDVIRRGDGSFSLRIRGVTSFMGSNEPLVVVDGLPLAQFGLSSALAGINPHDVTRIDVLKDAASTAIYGSRGANGVIVITTKRGR
jgi:TonB-dependent SusC/RagA subfamily outer membrane receptor